jgi:hypothetical protein
MTEKLSRRLFLKAVAALTASGTLAWKPDKLPEEKEPDQLPEEKEPDQPFGPYCWDAQWTDASPTSRKGSFALVKGNKDD